MAIADDLKSDINGALNFNWDMRDGQVVPSTADVALAGGGVNFLATMLYADLADSTGLAMWDKRVAARIFKAFLSSCSRLIKANDGFVRSFDGDRVMGVFLGPMKNTNATKCALQINWVFREVLMPKFHARFEGVRNGSHPLAHTTGIDTSDVLVARGGVRNDNDLVWVGRAPNIAAKLSGIREAPYATFITGEVYDMLANEAKFAASGAGPNMWESRTWANQPVTRVFRSHYLWRL
jgi:adenylate cyclase